MSLGYAVRSTDVLVIGSEGAGARAAIEAARGGCAVTVLTKGVMGRTGATLCAPGDYAVNSADARRLGLPGDVADSPAEHLRDTMDGGRGINDPGLAAVMCEEAYTRLRDLCQYGVTWSKLLKYGGHRYPRGATVGAVGKTGVTMMRALGREATRLGVRVEQNCFALDLVSAGDRIAGAVALDLESGEYLLYLAKATILATGGGGRLYDFTTMPEEATGDGYAMAYRAGADMIDMEFMQFIPYAMVWPPALRGNNYFVIELVSLLDTHLLNADGERFMPKYDPLHAEKSTRDVISRACVTEIRAGRASPHGGVFVRSSHLPPAEIDALAEELFPGWKIGAVSLPRFGIDPKREDLEIAPAAHFMMGGVRIDAKCRTSLPGLFAAGEVAGGAHGANRLSGNALTETQVFGAIAGAEAAREAAGLRRQAEPSSEEVAARLLPGEALLTGETVRAARGAHSGRGVRRPVFAVRDELRRRAYLDIGAARNATGLTGFEGYLTGLRAEVSEGFDHRRRSRTMNQEWLRALEIRNMVDLATMIAASAIRRQETRGAHSREDFPHPEQRRYSQVLRKAGDGAPMSFETLSRDGDGRGAAR